MKRGPKPSNKTIFVKFRITPDEFKSLTAYVKAKDVTISDFARFAVMSEVARPMARIINPPQGTKDLTRVVGTVPLKKKA